MNERHSSRLPFNENKQQNPINPIPFHQRPPTQQRPSLDQMSEVSLEHNQETDEHHYRDVHHEPDIEVLQEQSEGGWTATLDQGDTNGVKMLDVGYNQMRKSEFFNKRLKKDTSATRLTSDSNAGQNRIVSQGAPVVRFGGSQQNWMPH
jgi:hypothetical protein